MFVGKSMKKRRVWCQSQGAGICSLDSVADRVVERLNSFNLLFNLLGFVTPTLGSFIPIFTCKNSDFTILQKYFLTLNWIWDRMRPLPGRHNYWFRKYKKKFCDNSRLSPVDFVPKMSLLMELFENCDNSHPPQYLGKGYQLRGLNDRIWPLFCALSLHVYI